MLYLEKSSELPLRSIGYLAPDYSKILIEMLLYVN